jgi:hypothetical protein
MGSVISFIAGPPPKEEHVPIAKYTSPPNSIYGIPIPVEASIAQEDTETWYCDFWEHACAVPHKDGRNIIIYDPKETFYPYPRERPEWAGKRLRKAYELLGEGHPRIVRYVQRRVGYILSLT